MNEATSIIKGSQNNKLFTRSYIHPNEKAKLLILHGVGDHSGRYSNIVEKLYADNYSIFTYDHIGHGKSEGKRGILQSWSIFREDLQVVCNYFDLTNRSKPSFIFGQSMGGLIMLDYLMHKKHAFSGAIASSPALDNTKVSKFSLILFRFLNIILPHLILNSPLNLSELSRDKNVLKAYLNDPLNHTQVSPRLAVEFLDKIESTKKIYDKINIPILFTHGEDDGIVGIQGTLTYFEKLISTDKELITYPGGKHESHNDIHKDEAISNLLNWLNKHI